MREHETQNRTRVRQGVFQGATKPNMLETTSAVHFKMFLKKKGAIIHLKIKVRGNGTTLETWT